MNSVVCTRWNHIVISHFEFPNRLALSRNLLLSFQLLARFGHAFCLRIVRNIDTIAQASSTFDVPVEHWIAVISFFYGKQKHRFIWNSLSQNCAITLFRKEKVLLFSVSPTRKSVLGCSHAKLLSAPTVNQFSFWDFDEYLVQLAHTSFWYTWKTFVMQSRVTSWPMQSDIQTCERCCAVSHNS